jgi:hypothetical protein
VCCHGRQIHEPGARTDEQQDERVSSPPRRSLRERQDLSSRQQETIPCCSRATAQDSAEDREATTVVYKMDTAV